MINNFRRNGLDSLMVSGALLILLTPMFVIVSDKVYVDMMDRVFYVFTNCIFWFMAPIIITQLLYEKYLKEIDNLKIINPQRILVFITGALMIIYYMFFNMMIIYNVRSPGFFAPVLILFAPVISVSLNRVGIGNTLFIYGFHTVRFDSISAFKREVLKENIHVLIIKTNNDKRLDIKHNANIIDQLEQHIAKKMTKINNIQKE
ncbi:MAG: hypothetical protein Q8920_10325 [Bacillota bacterium]|nr:hypothetical protein [Bacillota bacterium]